MKRFWQIDRKCLKTTGDSGYLASFSSLHLHVGAETYPSHSCINVREHDTDSMSFHFLCHIQSDHIFWLPVIAQNCISLKSNGCSSIPHIIITLQKSHDHESLYLPKGMTPTGGLLSHPSSSVMVKLHRKQSEYY